MHLVGRQRRSSTPYNRRVDYAFPYGDGELTLSLPDGLNVTTVAPRPMPGIDPIQGLRRALESPTGARPLPDVLRGKREVLIAVTDHTRQNGYRRWLPELLNQINRAGVADANIALFVASAMRGPMTADEKREYFGNQSIDRVRTIDHDAESSSLVKAGRTDFGTVLQLNEHVYKAEALILTGGIQYHNFAGYTGGREAILPGACGLESINSNFQRALNSQGHLRNSVRPGVLSGNPFSDDMHEACILIKPSYYIDVILNPEGELAWFGAGDFGYVPRLGAKFLDEHNRISLSQPTDVAVIGAGGGRSGSTLYRAHKSLRQVERALAPGATVIWVARCEGGEGPSMLADWRGRDIDEVRGRAMRQGSLIGLAALVLKELAGKYEVHMVTALPADVVAGWGFKAHGTFPGALAAAAGGFGSTARWLVGADMSDVLAELQQVQEAAA